MGLRDSLVRLEWLLDTQFGLNPRKAFRSLISLPRFVRDLLRFRSGYSGSLELVPCLHDWSEEGGTTKSEYFWQDLLVARMVFEARPRLHVDVGSRVDGFVAHVASFREIEVLDVRPITTKVPGVTFRQTDLMNPPEGMADYCDSLSCLHALEHFGLGRYGDPIDPKGFERGLQNMAMLLKDNGTFYLSVPVGVDRVEFNANRVLDPRAVVALAEANALRPIRLSVIRPGGIVEESSLDAARLSDLSRQRYALAVFNFVKRGA